jgi:hypothetical protein
MALRTEIYEAAAREEIAQEDLRYMEAVDRAESVPTSELVKSAMTAIELSGLLGLASAAGGAGLGGAAGAIGAGKGKRLAGAKAGARKGAVTGGLHGAAYLPGLITHGLLRPGLSLNGDPLSDRKVTAHLLGHPALGAAHATYSGYRAGKKVREKSEDGPEKTASGFDAALGRAGQAVGGAIGRASGQHLPTVARYLPTAAGAATGGLLAAARPSVNEEDNTMSRRLRRGVVGAAGGALLAEASGLGKDIQTRASHYTSRATDHLPVRRLAEQGGRRIGRDLGNRLGAGIREFPSRLMGSFSSTKQASGPEKTAAGAGIPIPPKSVSERIMAHVNTPLGAAALTAAAPFVARGLASGATSLRDRMTRGKHLRSILDVHPHIAEEHSPEAIRLAFNSIRHFAPEITKEPLAGGNALQQVLSSKDSLRPKGPPIYSGANIAEAFGKARPPTSPSADAAAAAASAATSTFLKGKEERTIEDDIKKELALKARGLGRYYNP